MARARNIKPGFYKNEDLAECSIWARFIFPGLWMLADREGRLEDRPKRIKGELLPFDSTDVEPLLSELERFGFIHRYQKNGASFIQILKFKAHQTPHYSEKDSAIPPPELQESYGDDEEETPRGLQEDSKKECVIKGGSQPPDSLNPDSLNPESLENLCSPPSEAPALASSQSQQQGLEIEQTDRLPCPVEQIVGLYHSHMPRNPRCKVLNPPRRKAIAARWREAASLDAFPFSGGYADRDEGLAKWREFFAICADSDFLTGKAYTPPGRTPFLADIDFLFSPSGFAKTLENKYHREAA